MLDTNNKNEIEQVCSHWSPISKSCLLHQGGLFIPVDEHIKIYCQNSNYLTCQHFSEQAKPRASSTWEEKEENRRRFKRIQKRYYLRLSEYKPSAIAEVPIDECACTVDLSAGGIRLESCHCLALDSLISFYLDKEFSGSGLRGIGKVRWCKTLENTPLFHVGLDFLDDVAALAIREHLDARVV